MESYLTSESKVHFDSSINHLMGKAIKKASENLIRDIGYTLEKEGEKGCDIYLTLGKQEEECYTLTLREGNLEIQASSILGFVYGIYAISKELLGVYSFWFWNDQIFEKKKSITIPENFFIKSTPYLVKLRGWFINDEVLIHKWYIEGQKDKAWEMAFETLLRCGGNMVIPGTDENSRKYRKMASQMGLYITHHHAEPLGAKMFARVYPNLNASYGKYPELFYKLWEEALEEQKDFNIIWNLGFRGQGDCPFWLEDPMYDTEQARGKLISEIINKQYNLVKKRFPQAKCCTNLYGEVMELYKKDLVKLPEEVIKIWSDNGYGKMVSRRQENHNPRIVSLPEHGKEGCHGMYYHVSFYDLQAANHITMLTNKKEFIEQEVREIIGRGIKEYWIINCSNIKPHTYYLHVISESWKYGTIDIEDTSLEYIKQYFKYIKPEEILKCFDDYSGCAVAYGVEEDEHAGEQFCNYGTRVLATQWIKDSKAHAPEFLWATSANHLKEQIDWYKTCCKKGVKNYTIFVEKWEKFKNNLCYEDEVLFDDSILLHGKLYKYCYIGALYFCEGFMEFNKGNLQEAFYKVGKAVEFYKYADRCMREREHGKWKDFYENDCLTDIKHTAAVLEGVMAWLRIVGDGPHYYKWQREFLYSNEDKRVILITNMENHLTNQQLFNIMKKERGLLEEYK